MTQEELNNKIISYQCCAASLSYQALKAQQFNSPDAECLQCKLNILLKGIEILKNYTPIQGADYSDDYSEDYFI